MTPSTPPSGAIAWLKFIFAVAPELAQTLIPLGKDIAALFKAHPQLKPEDLAAFVTAVHASGDDLIAFILADKAAHPTVAPQPTVQPFTGGI